METNEIYPLVLVRQGVFYVLMKCPKCKRAMHRERKPGSYNVYVFKCPQCGYEIGNSKQSSDDSKEKGEDDGT